MFTTPITSVRRPSSSARVRSCQRELHRVAAAVTGLSAYLLSGECSACAREANAYQASSWSRTFRCSRGSTRFRIKAFNVPREMILDCPAYSAPTMGARRVRNNPIRFFHTLLMNKLGSKRAGKAMHQSRANFAKIWPELEDSRQISSTFIRCGAMEEQPQVHFGFAPCRLSTPFPFDKRGVRSLAMNQAH